MNEVQRKLSRLREIMNSHGAGAVRLRGVDWFAWITAGGNSTVIFTNEIGVAEALITPDHAWILTDRIERDRIAEEEMHGRLELMAFPWQETRAKTDFARKEAKGRLVYSDRPERGEEPLPPEIASLKLQLEPEEIERYRKLGHLAQEAMTDALAKAEPTWTEARLAGEGARALWERGIDPTLVMVGGAKRVGRHRHPIAKEVPLGDHAMMVFCGRRNGLYANLTRWVFFREPTEAERKVFRDVARIEAAVFDASKPGRTLRDVYRDIQKAYEANGYPGEIDRHHQGGPTGYLSREFVAGPESPEAIQIQTNMALAWNPSLPGAKIEDTVLVTERGLEDLTLDPKAWPCFEMNGRLRPDVWVKT